jgi:hypothetical protein
LVRQAMVRSLQHWTRKHAAALTLSHTSVKRILPINLNLHPYKMIMVQNLKLTKGHYVERNEAVTCDNMLQGAMQNLCDTI